MFYWTLRDVSDLAQILKKGRKEFSYLVLGVIDLCIVQRIIILNLIKKPHDIVFTTNCAVVLIAKNFIKCRETD